MSTNTKTVTCEDPAKYNLSNFFIYIIVMLVFFSLKFFKLVPKKKTASLIIACYIRRRIKFTLPKLAKSYMVLDRILSSEFGYKSYLLIDTSMQSKKRHFIVIHVHSFIFIMQN